MIKSHLFYRVFKSEYFPNGTILYANQSSGSFAWESKLKSRRVISMDAKWRVGDGMSISVFRDNWLPNASGGRLIASVPGVDQNVKVAY